MKNYEAFRYLINFKKLINNLMDLYKEFEKRDRPRSVVEKTELAKITRKSETQSFPLKSTCKKAPGEYFPTLNDTIKVNTMFKYLVIEIFRNT
jgi:hypothetical protein